MPERTLDCRPSLDPRNRRHRFSAPVERAKKLHIPPKVRTDQGNEGACVGFGYTNWLMSMPNRYIPSDDPNSFARMVYQDAKEIDEWEGTAYEGTSVVAGAKVLQELGLISAYEWAFTVDEVVAALQLTPVVLGIPWYQSMYGTRPSGLIEVGGQLAGWHCIEATGFHPNVRLAKEGMRNTFEVVKLRNSWGMGYGRRGDGWLRTDDLAEFLTMGADCCVPVRTP